jgi:hypothetical protein
MAGPPGADGGGGGGPPPAATDEAAPILSWPALYGVVLGALVVQVVLYAALARVFG